MGRWKGGVWRGRGRGICAWARWVSSGDLTLNLGLGLEVNWGTSPLHFLPCTDFTCAVESGPLVGVYVDVTDAVGRVQRGAGERGLVCLEKVCGRDSVFWKDMCRVWVEIMQKGFGVLRHCVD